MNTATKNTGLIIDVARVPVRLEVIVMDLVKRPKISPFKDAIATISVALVRDP